MAAIVAFGAAILLAIVLRQKANGGIDPDQHWFWTPEWLGGELEAEQEIAAGEGDHYDSDQAFEQALRSRMKPL